MAGYFVVGALAAFGLLSVLWVVAGWILPDGMGCVICCWGVPDERILWRYRWLRETGIFRGPLLVITDEVQMQCPEGEICSGEALLSRLEWERNRIDGTGNGDPPGRGQCRGVSEL